MTKTKLTVEIFGHSSDGVQILQMIGNHNEGKTRIDLDVIRGWIKGNEAKFPGHSSNIKYQDWGDFGLKIFEGERLIMAITENELFELKEEKESGEMMTM